MAEKATIEEIDRKILELVDMSSRLSSTTSKGLIKKTVGGLLSLRGQLADKKETIQDAASLEENPIHEWLKNEEQN